MTIPATISPIENALVRGDLATLSPEERAEYYKSVCKSLGLNPLTRPFDYIVLNGKLTLYARRDAADQLRRNRAISLEIVSRRLEDDILTVHVKASGPDGRRDEDYGAVYMPASLKGEARANLELKAVTKAKRRATLSICGLGWLDETEVADVPQAVPPPPPSSEREKREAQNLVALPSSAASYEMTMATLERASEQGYDSLRKVWNDLDPGKKAAFRDHKERFIEQAKASDQARGAA